MYIIALVIQQCVLTLMVLSVLTVIQSPLGWSKSIHVMAEFNSRKAARGVRLGEKEGEEEEEEEGGGRGRGRRERKREREREREREGGGGRGRGRGRREREREKRMRTEGSEVEKHL